MALQAKKLNQEKFQTTDGYYMFTGEWGVVNSETQMWVTFDGQKPYIPAGKKKACVEVANECDPTELLYLSTLGGSL